MKRTPTSQLVELKLGEDLAAWVTALRADERSWSYITRKIGERTGIAVSDESLRLWFADEDVAA